MLISTQITDDSDFLSKESSVTTVRERYNHISKISNGLWRRWSTEYLTMLREGQQSNTAVSKLCSVVGEIVLVAVEGSRLQWKLVNYDEIV